MPLAKRRRGEIVHQAYLLLCVCCLIYLHVLAAPRTPKVPPPKTKKPHFGATSRSGSRSTEPIVITSSDPEPEMESEQSDDDETPRRTLSSSIKYHKANASNVRLNHEKPSIPTYPVTQQFSKLKTDSNARKKKPSLVSRWIIRCELRIQDQSGRSVGTRCADQSHGFMPEEVSDSLEFDLSEMSIYVRYCSRLSMTHSACLSICSTIPALCGTLIIRTRN